MFIGLLKRFRRSNLISNNKILGGNYNGCKAHEERTN